MKKILICATLVAAMMGLQSCEPEETPIQGGGNEPNAECIINGHEYVDLGLSVKWATCNVGATLPEDYGDYFAWGEIAPKNVYSEENSVAWNNPSLSNIIGDSLYDAARANWGATWRLPTHSELQELMDNCTYEWATRNGIHGALLTSKRNGKSIFMPAAGFRDDVHHENGKRGAYWCSQRVSDNEFHSYHLKFHDLYIDEDWHGCHFGSSVRPVSD